MRTARARHLCNNITRWTYLFTNLFSPTWILSESTASMLGQCRNSRKACKEWRDEL